MFNFFCEWMSPLLISLLIFIFSYFLFQLYICSYDQRDQNPWWIFFLSHFGFFPIICISFYDQLFSYFFYLLPTTRIYFYFYLTVYRIPSVGVYTHFPPSDFDFPSYFLFLLYISFYHQCDQIFSPTSTFNFPNLFTFLLTANSSPTFFYLLLAAHIYLYFYLTVHGNTISGYLHWPNKIV